MECSGGLFRQEEVQHRALRFRFHDKLDKNWRRNYIKIEGVELCNG